MASKRGLTVLVVDDNELVLESVDSLLAQQGYSVIAADRPTKALAFLSDPNQEIDILLTDFQMPEMTGTELARRGFRLRPKLRSVFSSSDAACRTTFRSSDPFLLKPFTISDLQESLDLALKLTPGFFRERRSGRDRRQVSE